MSRRPTLVALVLAAASGAALVAFTRPATAARPVAGWEYHVVRGVGIDLGALPKVQDEQIAATTGTLNALGAEGWELTMIQGPFAVLRRAR